MDVWAQVLVLLGRRLSQQCMDTWFSAVACDGVDGSVLRLTVPNETFRTSLLTHYGESISEAASEVLRQPVQLEVRGSPPAQEEAGPRPVATVADVDPPSCVLNPKYTFDTFVVGASNQFARAAACAVAERPAHAYNPLYIYGGVGLGKTHLMHAVGHFIRQKNSRLRLAYMSSERFMNELVNSIRYDRILQFRQKYRNIDVLLMDDVQFLAGKERTQEEFFHTFNSLYDSQKQIVITSDCPPRDIPTLEERLHSRFQWGLIADIQPPDLETKLAILRKKAASQWFLLPDPVAMYIAANVRSSIRELEGALIRLTARASLEGMDPSDIDVEYAKDVLRDLVGDDSRPVSTDAIVRAVAGYYGLKPAQLKSKSNARRISQPRQIAMYICKHTAGLSLPQIGRELGGKHHTTVLHSIRKITSLKQKDREIAEAVEKILLSIR
jgi:chromosomal replication initiator protein